MNGKTEQSLIPIMREFELRYSDRQEKTDKQLAVTCSQMTDMQKTVDRIEIKLDDLCDKLDEKEVKLQKTFADREAKWDTRYANKDIQYWFVGACALILSIVLGALIYQVIIIK